MSHETFLLVVVLSVKFSNLKQTPLKRIISELVFFHQTVEAIIWEDAKLRQNYEKT